VAADVEKEITSFVYREGTSMRFAAELVKRPGACDERYLIPCFEDTYYTCGWSSSKPNVS